METRRVFFSKLRMFAASGGVAALAIHSTAGNADSQSGTANGNCAAPQLFRSTETRDFYNSCASEQVRFTVEFKHSLQSCRQDDGGTLFKIHTRLHGSGYGLDPFTGVPTGTNYILNVKDRSRQVFSPGSAQQCVPLTLSEVYREKLISKGRSANSSLVINSTFLVDPYCNIDMKDTFDWDCRG